MCAWGRTEHHSIREVGFGRRSLVACASVDVEGLIGAGPAAAALSVEMLGLLHG